MCHLLFLFNAANIHSFFINARKSWFFFIIFAIENENADENTVEHVGM